jgi:hypothetical protein
MGETGQPAEDSEDISEGTVDNSSGVIMEDVENTENAENSEDAFGEAEEGVSEEISSEDGRYVRSNFFYFLYNESSTFFACYFSVIVKMGIEKDKLLSISFFF